MCKSRAANTELLAGGVGQGKGEMENETGTGWGDDTAVSTARADGGGLQKPHLICWNCQVALAALHPEQRARPPRCSPPFRGLLGQSTRGPSLQSADTTAGERQHSENSLQQGVRAVSMSPRALLWHMGHRRIHRSAHFSQGTRSLAWLLPGPWPGGTREGPGSGAGGGRMGLGLLLKCVGFGVAGEVST